MIAEWLIASGKDPSNRCFFTVDTTGVKKDDLPVAVTLWNPSDSDEPAVVYFKYEDGLTQDQVDLVKRFIDYNAFLNEGKKPEDAWKEVNDFFASALSKGAIPVTFNRQFQMRYFPDDVRVKVDPLDLIVLDLDMQMQPVAISGITSLERLQREVEAAAGVQGAIIHSFQDLQRLYLPLIFGDLSPNQKKIRQMKHAYDFLWTLRGISIT